MLSLLHQQHYEALKQALDSIDEIIVSSSIDRGTLQSDVTALQQLFREQILQLPLDDMPLDLQHWIQSYHVEIDKQLRLLSVDVTFLQAARQSTTTEQRRQQIRDRLETLRQYCSALLERGNRNEG